MEFRRTNPEAYALPQQDTDPHIIMGGVLASSLLGPAVMHLNANEARQSYLCERREIITYLSFLGLRSTNTQLTLYRSTHPVRTYKSYLSTYQFTTSINITWIDHDAAKIGVVHFVPVDTSETQVDVHEQSAVWSYRGTNDDFLWHKSGGLDVLADGPQSADPETVQSVRDIIAQCEVSDLGMQAITAHLRYTRIGHPITPTRTDSAQAP